MQFAEADDVSQSSGTGPMDALDVSVIVPTHNRRDRLEQVLIALNRQQTVTEAGRRFDFEVVVVSDGSSDGTSEMVRSLPVGFPLRLIEQENAGPAAARNRGVDAARGRTIVFIDDDVVPGVRCLAAHASHHDQATDVVVIGPMLTPPGAAYSPWVAWEQHQLYKQYRRFADGEPAHARQFYTGNASVSRSAFMQSGGFDTSFKRAEDVELAHRLQDAGQLFLFEFGAEAFHHAERSLESWLQVASDYGEHDVAFSRRGQPWMREFIAAGFARRSLAQRALIRIAISSPRRTRRIRHVLVYAALFADKVRLRTPSRWLFSAAYSVNYYAGVASSLGSVRAFDDLTAHRPAPQGRPFCALFVLEQTLGHVTHSDNLRAIVPMHGDIRALFAPINDRLDGAFRHIPGWSNWTIRAGVRARTALRRTVRDLADEDPPARPDVVFVHSQVPAVLLGRWMRRLPTVVSLDATPLQYDELGEFYGHAVAAQLFEYLKHWANRRCYQRARHLITWSDWARDGLVEHYGVPREKVTVIAPGVDLETWFFERHPTTPDQPLRILFVGGDFRRKGGDLLLEAWRKLSENPELPALELHLVTNADIAPEPGLIVHPGLRANSPELIEQYRLADVFCLPTLGDCLPMVLAEAAAAGLPLVSTDVGAISELVRDGETGRLLTKGNVEEIIDALEDLARSPEKRSTYGRNARTFAERDHDARQNAARVLQLLRTTGVDGQTL